MRRGPHRHIAVSHRSRALTSIVDRASVIDGDTIELRGQHIRLFGIDAPEGRQSCTCARARLSVVGRELPMPSTTGSATAP